MNAGILRASTNNVTASASGPFGNNVSGLNLNGGIIQTNVATFSRPITVTATNSGIDAYGSARTISSTINNATVSTSYNLNIGGTTNGIFEGQNLTLSGVITNTPATLSLTKIGTNTASFTNQAVTIQNLSINAGTLTSTSATLSVAGGFSNYGTFTHNSGTVTFNGSSLQGIGAATFNNLTINNAAGITLWWDVTHSAILTLSSGIVATGAFTLTGASTASVSRTSGHVNGKFQKNVATGATSKTFEIGDATNYTPVTVGFASVTTAGDLIASTTAGDHSDIANSIITPTNTANRIWTLTNQGIVFTTYDATFTFVPGDLDAAAATGNFIVGKYSAGWTYPTVGTKTTTSTQAIGVSAFSDFQMGEVVTLPVRYTDVKAIGKNAHVEIEWKVAEESRIVKYIVEKSGDGFSFTKAAEILVAGNNNFKTYSWLDRYPAGGNNYYYVRAIQDDGRVFLSKRVVIKINFGTSSLNVYPNPVEDKRIHVRGVEMQKGKYNVVLLNPPGQQMLSRQYDHPGGSFSQVISGDESMVPGVYYLKISNQNQHYIHSIFIN